MKHLYRDPTTFNGLFQAAYLSPGLESLVSLQPWGLNST